MQINHRFYGQNFASIEDLLAPAKNVDYAARILRQLLSHHGSRPRSHSILLDATIPRVQLTGRSCRVRLIASMIFRKVPPCRQLSRPRAPR